MRGTSLGLALPTCKSSGTGLDRARNLVVQLQTTTNLACIPGSIPTGLWQPWSRTQGIFEHFFAFCVPWIIWSWRDLSSFLNRRYEKCAERGGGGHCRCQARRDELPVCLPNRVDRFNRMAYMNSSYADNGTDNGYNGHTERKWQRDFLSPPYFDSPDKSAGDKQNLTQSLARHWLHTRPVVTYSADHWWYLRSSDCLRWRSLCRRLYQMHIALDWKSAITQSLIFFAQENTYQIWRSKYMDRPQHTPTRHKLILQR